jgi:hypothetical protein
MISPPVHCSGPATLSPRSPNLTFQVFIVDLYRNSVYCHTGQGASSDEIQRMIPAAVIRVIQKVGLNRLSTRYAVLWPLLPESALDRICRREFRPGYASRVSLIFQVPHW